MQYGHPPACAMVSHVEKEWRIRSLLRIVCACLRACVRSAPLVREGRRLRVFEKRMPRRICKPKTEAIRRGYRKLRNRGLHM
jgi:hypothetical protein